MKRALVTFEVKTIDFDLTLSNPVFRFRLDAATSQKHGIILCDYALV